VAAVYGCWAPVLLVMTIGVRRRRHTWGRGSVTWQTLAVDNGWRLSTMVGAAGAHSVRVDGVSGVVGGTYVAGFRCGCVILAVVNGRGREEWWW